MKGVYQHQEPIRMMAVFLRKALERGSGRFASCVESGLGDNVACPFFSPSERAENLALPHPARLPLGAAWRGACTVPGGELVQLGAVELESCNLGYAQACPRLPKERAADAVRFAVNKESTERLQIQFVLESKHLPIDCGTLQYDRIAQSWTSEHSDSRIQRLADCFLEVYLERNAP